MNNETLSTSNDTIEPISQMSCIKLRDSFSQQYPNDSFEDFVYACTPKVIAVIENFKNPQMIADPKFPNHWVIIDRRNTVSGKNFTETIDALNALGLELLSKRLFKLRELRNFGWSWLATKKSKISQGRAKVGYCQGPNIMRVYFNNVDYRDDSLGGRGQLKVPMQK